MLCKCLSCPECPECFRQVKGVYDTLLALMAKLDMLLGDVPSGGSVSTDDFDKALQQTRRDINRLLNATRDARSLDDDLLQRLDNLDDLIAQLIDQIARMNKTLSAGEGHGSNAASTVTDSQSVVDEIKQLIDNIMKRIDDRAKVALNDAKAASAAGEDQNKQLQGILRDATAKANDQDTQASQIRKNADDAVAIARQANRMAKAAVDLQQQAIDAVTKLVADIANASKLAKEANDAVDDAAAGSSDVLTKSQQVLNLAKMPLSDIDSDGLLQRATDALSNASRLVLNADRLLQDNAALIKFVRQARDDTALLLDEGKKSQQKAAELLAIVNAAVRRVDDAMDSGKLRLSNAEELKGDLEDITNKLEQYKAELNRALNTMKQASSMTDKNTKLSAGSLATLEAARRNATAARDIGMQAQNLAGEVLKV